MAQNFPSADLPVIDASTGRMNAVWWRFFQTLFARTGASNGDTGVLDTVFGMFPAPVPAAENPHVLALIGALRSEADDLRREVAELRAMVVESRKTATTPPAEVYAFMRR